MEKNLYGVNLERLKNWMSSHAFPAYRADQLYDWLQKKHVERWSEMSNIPNNIRESLQSEGYNLRLPVILKKSVSGDKNTSKLLLKLEDGLTIETVLMQYLRQESRNRNTVCVSTQVGCAMGCPFCATGKNGLVRNLNAAEILGQIVIINKLLGKKDEPSQVTNVVYMGMGEPLNNYESLLQSIRLISDHNGLNIGKRRITVSTCGIVPKIYQLAKEELPITLAISLHASTDALRDELVPINKRYPLVELMEACRAYYAATQRRLTFEYTLIENINDSLEDAKNLASLLSGFHANINIIPLNEVSHANYKKPHDPTAFVKKLSDVGINAIIRQEMGLGIDAACGQLKENKYE